MFEVPALVDRVKAALAEGMSVVIGLTSTGVFVNLVRLTLMVSHVGQAKLQRSAHTHVQLLQALSESRKLRASQSIHQRQ